MFQKSQSILSLGGHRSGWRLARGSRTRWLIITLWLGAGSLGSLAAPSAAASDQSEQTRLLRAAGHQGLSEGQAGRAAQRICQRLWGNDPRLKLQSATLDSGRRTWSVTLFADNGLDGWGCEVEITRSGQLLSVRYLMGD